MLLTERTVGNVCQVKAASWADVKRVTWMGVLVLFRPPVRAVRLIS